MDERETLTFEALVRLLKSRLRRRVYEDRAQESAVTSVLTLEQGLQMSAQKGWLKVRKTWNLKDTAEMTKLKYIVSEAAHTAYTSVVATFQDLDEGSTWNHVQELLQQEMKDPEWFESLFSEDFPRATR